MHGEQIAASICKNGACKIYLEQMMSYNLYLEEDLGDDIDIGIQNLDNFYQWCASRVLTLDRESAKEILNSIKAVNKVELNQIREVFPQWFEDEKTGHIFFQRRKLLQY